MYLSVNDLTRDQIVELKQNYLERLADEGVLNEVLYDDAEADEEADGVSYEELANADALVSDDVIFREYEGTVFTEDDFSSAA
jgi:hypothetical protein